MCRVQKRAAHLSDQDRIPTLPPLPSIETEPLNLIESMIRSVLGEHDEAEREHWQRVEDLLKTIADGQLTLEKRVSELERKVAALEKGHCPLLQP